MRLDNKHEDLGRSKDVELRQLRYFLAVAEALSFGKAAQKLHLSQPPLSRQILNLEKSLGVTLFNRSNGGVKLTAAGSVFLRESQQILERLEQAAILAQRTHRGECGKIDVGCSAYLDLAVHDFIKTSLGSRAPGLNVQFHSCASAEQARFIRHCGLDAGLVRLPLPDFDHLALEVLCREPILAMVASGHPFSARHRLAAKDLTDTPVVMMRRSVPLTHDRIYRFCAQENLKPEILEPTAPFCNLLDSVRRNGRVGLVPSAVRHAHLQGVAFIPFHEPHASSAIGILYRRNDTNLPLSEFVDTIREMPIDLLERG